MSDDYEKILQALLDADQLFPPKFLHQLSDLDKNEQELLLNVWEQILQVRKLNLLEDLIDLSDAETLVNFDDIGIIALKDKSIDVRLKALKLLEYSEDYHLIIHLLKVIKNDKEESVRVAALETVSIFVYKGEVDEYPREIFYRLTSILKELFNEINPSIIRQKALEALGYSSEREIKKYIEFAFAQDDESWRNSALIAMGRSLDSRWKKHILDELSQDNPGTVISAIKAAGDLEIQSARKMIIDMITRHQDDEFIKKNSAWALSRIGGPGVKSILEKLITLADNENDTVFYEECLDEYDFQHDHSAQSMFNFRVGNDDDINPESFIEDEIDFEDDEDINENLT